MTRIRPFGLLLLAALLLGGGTGSAADPPWIAVIVPTNDQDALDAGQLSLIYRRKQSYGRDGERLQPVNLPADSPLRRRFSRAVLGQNPEAFEGYWNELYFQGVVPPHVLASEAAVLRFVGETAHAIGYLDACLVDATVRVVLLVDPDENVRLPGAAPACGR